MLAHRLVVLQRGACRNDTGYDFVFFGFMPSIGYCLLSFVAVTSSLVSAGFCRSSKLRSFT
jgi:hypothetical protein